MLIASLPHLSIVAGTHCYKLWNRLHLGKRNFSKLNFYMRSICTIFAHKI